MAYLIYIQQRRAYSLPFLRVVLFALLKSSVFTNMSAGMAAAADDRDRSVYLKLEALKDIR